MSRSKKKKSQLPAVIITIILFFTLIAVAGYFIYPILFPKATKTEVKGNSSAKTSLKGKSPTKTSDSAGYTPESSVKVAVGSPEQIVESTDPGWTRVPSKKKLDKFTDLSKNGLTIWRINNAEVLKTVDSQTTPATLISDQIAKYPDALILNTSAFNMETGYAVGLQISNGQLLRDWNPSGNQVAFVINKDGSVKIYNQSTPASEIIANGGVQSYDFGGAQIIDGQVQPSDGSVDWKLHSFIANDKDNNLYAICSDTGYGYENIMATVADLNLQNMLLLDGGGSSQLAVQGRVVVPSQDNRAVPDYIVMK